MTRPVTRPMTGRQPAARAGGRTRRAAAAAGAARASVAVASASLLLALSLNGPAAAAAAAADAGPAVAGEVLVKLVASAELPVLLQRHGLSLKAQFGARPIYRLQVLPGTTVDAALKGLRAEPAVQLAEPNGLHASPEARKNQPWVIGEPGAFAQPWAAAALRLPQAWALAAGQGITVAVLDTGIDAAHPALAGRVLPGWDFVDGDPWPAEAANPAAAGWGHGTHVAGTIARAAPGAHILPLRVLDADGVGNVWVLAEALLRAVDPDGNPATADGAQVINLSLGTPQRTRLLDAVARLASCAPADPANPVAERSDPGYADDEQRCAAGGGAVVVAAAGNDSSDKLQVYPAAEGVYGLLAITASTASQRLAGFANRGGWIDAAAPGEAITSALPGGAWGSWSGSSMATAWASGVAALLRGREPGLSPVDVVRRLVRSSAPLCDTKLPQIDAAAALGAARQASASCR